MLGPWDLYSVGQPGQEISGVLQTLHTILLTLSRLSEGTDPAQRTRILYSKILMEEMEETRGERKPVVYRYGSEPRAARSVQIKRLSEVL